MVTYLRYDVRDDGGRYRPYSKPCCNTWVCKNNSDELSKSRVKPSQRGQHKRFHTSLRLICQSGVMMETLGFRTPSVGLATRPIIIRLYLFRLFVFVPSLGDT